VTQALLAPPRPGVSPGWLRGPAFDGALLLGVPALALALGGVSAFFPAFFLYALFFDIWVLAYPHVTSTFTRIAFDRASARRHWFLLAGLPLLVLAGTAAVGALGGAGGLYTAYYVGQTYHYTRQSYGIARVYRRRAGASGTGWLADAVVYAFPVWGLLLRAQQGHEVFYDNPLWLPRVSPLAAGAAGVLAWGLLLAWGHSEWRERASVERRGHVAFVLSHVAITVVGYAVIGEITTGWLVVNVWHNAQYLLFVWGANATRFQGGFDAASPLLSRLCQPRNAWAYALFCVAFGAGLFWLIDLLGGRVAAGAFPLLLVLHLTVNFHHYLVDGVIWKTRRAAAAAA